MILFKCYRWVYWVIMRIYKKVYEKEIYKNLIMIEKGVMGFFVVGMLSILYN